MGQPVQPVQPQPSPTAWGYGEAQMNDGTIFGFVVVHTVLGPVHVFLTPDEGITVAGTMSTHFRELKKKSKLILPPGASAGLVSPTGAPLRSVPAPASTPEQPTDSPPSED